jgi:Ca-activated chloride channel family protein
VWVRLTFFTLGFFFFCIGLSRPQIGAKIKEHETKGAEIMIVLDVSNSMLAEDYSPNRLERAKLAISRLVDKLRDDRIGLIVFAGNSFVQLPITTDYVSAKMFLNSISTDSVPIQGTAIGEAINTAIRSFSAQSEKSRAIIIITDGENHEDDPVAAAKQAAEMGIRVFAIGVGSPEGKPIPMDGELLKDKDGNIVVTRLEEPILRDVASEGNGAYVRAGNSEFGLNPIIDDIRKMEDEKYSSIVFEEFDEQFMYFMAIALFFFVLEMLIGDRRSKRHLFRR